MAQTLARLGVARLGITRLGHFNPVIRLYYNGVERGQANTRIAGASITQILNHEPDTATFRVEGFTPAQGAEIGCWLGDLQPHRKLFGGVVLTVTRGYDTRADADHLVFDLSCIDYTWLLKRRKVLKRYTSTSAYAIVLDLVASFSSGFTTVNVSVALAAFTIDEITYTDEDLDVAITRLMVRVGGYWYCDYFRDIHAFITEVGAIAGSVTDASTRGAHDASVEYDLSQIITRVKGRGGGSQAASDAAIGQTTLPVDDASWYSGSGGSVRVGPQVLSYTGVAGTTGTGSATGYINPPPALVAAPGTGGSLTPGATYLVAATYETDEGETTIGPTTAVVLGGGDGQIQINPMPVPTDPKIHTKHFYVSDPNGGVGTLKHYTDRAAADTGAQLIVDHSATGAPPTTNGAGYATESAAAGSTTLPVEDLAQFAASGWVEVPGGQLVRYTGRSASAGAGTLTGIPASGIGAITAQVRAGTVRSVAHLTGIPASSTGSILFAINKGDEVQVAVERNDAAAQAVLAALMTAVSSDGIHEDAFTDGRLSQIEVTNRADAMLAEHKTAIGTVRWETRDPSVIVGREITFALTNPAIVGTFKILRVHLSDIARGGGRNTIFPKRRAEGSTKRFSFEDLLRRVRG